MTRELSTVDVIPDGRDVPARRWISENDPRHGNTSADRFFVGNDELHLLETCPPQTVSGALDHIADHGRVGAEHLVVAGGGLVEQVDVSRHRSRDPLPIRHASLRLLGTFLQAPVSVFTVDCRQPRAVPPPVDFPFQRIVVEAHGRSRSDYMLPHVVGVEGIETFPVDSPWIVVVVLTLVPAPGALQQADAEIAHGQLDLAVQGVQDFRTQACAQCVPQSAIID
jgi:hypothetical protein